MARAFCPEGHHYPEEVIAHPNSVMIDTDGTNVEEFSRPAVLLYGDGSCTNRYEDGTIGVWSDEDLVEAAEACETVYCPEHICECDWHHTDPVDERVLA